MNTIISSNLKRTSERIDPAGNVINPRTKQIVKPIEAEYVPPVVTPEVKQETPMNTMSEKINKMVEEKVKEKIDAIVEQRVAEALKNL